MIRARVAGFVRAGLIRRVAFGLEALDRLRRPPFDDVPAPEGRTVRTEDCQLLAVVAHWRGSGDHDPAPFHTCLAGLLGTGTERLEIVVVTDRDADVLAELAALRAAGDLRDVELRQGPWEQPATTPRSITVHRWRPRWPYRHGFYLTWEHKRIFQRAHRTGAFTHLLALEDDIGFTAENLAYWLVARAPLAERGLITGFVRFEQRDGRAVLSDQSRTGQHVDAGVAVELPDDALRPARVSMRPYQALMLLDRPLAERHLTSSSTRSPLRSAVLTWGVRERASAGETFRPTARPLVGVLRPASVPRPVSRHAVLVNGATAATRPVAGALVEHLRPLTSVGEGSRVATVPVDEY